MALVTLRFHDVDFEIIDKDGEKYVPARRLARALEYSTTTELLRLVRRNQQEFEGKIKSVKLTENPKGGRPEAIISYHGVIRVAMLSDAPRAKEFRDWAESVLYPVMTQGYYLPAGGPPCAARGTQERRGGGYPD